MRRALDEFLVTGIKTSIPFHRRVLANEKFLSGRFDTSFIETEMLAAKPAGPPGTSEERGVAVMLAAIAVTGERQDVRCAVTLGSDTRRVEVKQVGPALYDVRIDGGSALRIDAARSAGLPYSVLLAGRQLECSVDPRANGKLDVTIGATAFTVAVVEEG